MYPLTTVAPTIYGDEDGASHHPHEDCLLHVEHDEPVYEAHIEPEFALPILVTLVHPETATLHVLEYHAQFVPTAHVGHALLSAPELVPDWH